VGGLWWWGSVCIGGGVHLSLLTLYLSIYMCLYLSTYFSFYLYLSLSIYVSIYIQIYIYMYIYINIYINARVGEDEREHLDRLAEAHLFTEETAAREGRAAVDECVV